MTTSPQLLIVETLFLSSGTKRSTYVLVLTKEVTVEVTPEAEAAAFTLGLGRPQTASDAAAIFVLSRYDDDEMAYHGICEGVLLEADEVIKRPSDAETPTHQIWFVAEVR